MPTVWRAVRRGRSLALALPLTLACGGESLGPPRADPSTLYWDLILNHHAVMLSTTAPYDTLTMVATPRSSSQEPLEGLPAPQYVSEDPERVLVTPEGTLVALAPMAPGTHVKVTATLTAGNLKHTDYVLVRVVDNPAPPVLASLSVHPLPPDTAKFAAYREGEGALVGYQLPVRATDTTGAPMTDPFVSFRSSDKKIAVIDEVTGLVQGILPGRVNFYATETAYGVAKADTLRFRIGLPITSRFVFQTRPDGTPGSILQERELRVGVGAAVLWQAFDADATTDADITFTDPTQVAAFPTSPVYSHPAASHIQGTCDFFAFILPGTVDCTGSGNFVLRRGFHAFQQRYALGAAARAFPVAGTYAFHSTLQGFDGRIVVVDESEE